jgi:hypothetical protein
MTDKAINFDDEEYTIPGELLTTATAARRTVEAWPERTDQRLDAIEARLRHVETLLHQRVNAGDGCK